jgi:hypothetical protein
VHVFNAVAANEYDMLHGEVFMFGNNKYLHSQRLSLRHPPFLAWSLSYTAQDHLGTHGEGFHAHLCIY